MSKTQCTPLLACLLAGAGLAVINLPVLANVATECRLEAEEFDIIPEQQEDYINNCVLSRGGTYSTDPAVEDYSPPMEGGMAGDAGADNSHGAQ